MRERDRESRRAPVFALSAALACVFCAGCTDDPEPTTLLTLRFSHQIGGAAVAMGQTYTTRYGHEVTFDHVRYWVSNVAAERDGQRFAAPASYFLVEQTPGGDRLTITARGIPPGTYDRLVFHIGVDPAHNASLDRMEGELQPGIGMDWSWDTGYKFFRTQGEFVQGDLAGPFSFHTGMNVLYKELSVELPSALELVLDQDVGVSIEAELDRVFAGIQLATDAEIAGGTVDSPAAQVAGNYSRMFRLVWGDQTIPFTPASPNVDGPVDDGTIPGDGTPPVLSEPVIALPSALFCDAVPGRPAADERGCMTPFTHVPASSVTYDAGLFTFITQNGEPVRATSAGYVSDVRFLVHSALTHSDLFTITVRPNADSAFFLEYQNVKEPVVAEGDSVSPGQVLGGAGDYFSEAHGLVAFGVHRKQELVQRLCPTTFTSSALTDTYQMALGESNAAWPSHAYPSLCSSPSLVCAGDGCEAPESFVPVQGDIDEGRRIYKTSCASCHGAAGQGDIGPELCNGPGCSCLDCVDHPTLAASIEFDMPPEGYCNPKCAADVAAFILHAFSAP